MPKGPQGQKRPVDTVARAVTVGEIALGANTSGARWNEGRLEVTEQARLMRALFEHPGRTHIDVKFFRGASSDVSPEDVCRVANNIIFQIDSGMVEADEAFEESFKQVEIAELLMAL